ncbi:MAG: phosphatase PAP2 family protein [Bacilli bacterium]|nr:phosphatase PAP2 family protein [Bacilli bacterium]
MKKRYIISITFLLLFLIITVLMINNNMKIFDDNIYNYIFKYQNSTLNNIFKIISKFGNPLIVIILIFILLIFLEKEDIYKLIMTILLTVSTNQLLKHTIRRIRPNHITLIKEKGFSYPSGHAMISIALYGFLIYLVYTKIKNKIIKTILILLLVLLILGIGISRIYLGVHYPSDIIAGYSISLPIIVLIICSVSDHFRGNINDKDGSK